MGEQNEITTIMKRGELCIEAEISRGLAGLCLRVKVHPRVEEFFRELGQNTSIDCRKYGRYWTPLNKETPLLVYNQQGDTVAGCLSMSNGHMYRLDKPGAPLMEAYIHEVGNGGMGEAINVSFLRLQGASLNDGVSFKVAGVFTTDAIKNISTRIGEAAQAFYITYLRPINLDVQISTQEYVGVR